MKMQLQAVHFKKINSLNDPKLVHGVLIAVDLMIQNSTSGFLHYFLWIGALMKLNPIPVYKFGGLAIVLIILHCVTDNK